MATVAASCKIPAELRARTVLARFAGRENVAEFVVNGSGFAVSCNCGN